MDFMQGGELNFHLKTHKKLPEIVVRFLAAEILLALEYLHSQNIVYRDLKPYNLMLTADGHIKLIDFGLSKKFNKEKNKTYSFCGTMGYLAPEIYYKKGHDFTADWWSYGAVLYQMVAGHLPFYKKDHEEMYSQIINKGIAIEENIFSKELYKLLKGLLHPQPELRMGNQNDTEEIKNHEFFKTIDWDLLSKKNSFTFGLKIKQ